MKNKKKHPCKKCTYYKTNLCSDWKYFIPEKTCKDFEEETLLWRFLKMFTKEIFVKGAR